MSRTTTKTKTASRKQAEFVRKCVMLMIPQATAHAAARQAEIAEFIESMTYAPNSKKECKRCCKKAKDIATMLEEQAKCYRFWSESFAKFANEQKGE